MMLCSSVSAILFLSTPSARRATPRSLQSIWCHSISIHALREEGDLWMLNPLPACKRFLSTPSARRATCHRCRVP